MRFFAHLHDEMTLHELSQELCHHNNMLKLKYSEIGDW